MRRRVGSANAAKVRFNLRAEYLTMRLTIYNEKIHCATKKQNTTGRDLPESMRIKRPGTTSEHAHGDKT